MADISVGDTWSHIQRMHGNAHSLSVEALHESLKRANYDVERQRIIEIFKEFERRKIGDLVYGRRGHPTRMIWNKLPSDGLATIQVPGTAAAPAPEPAAMIDHSFPLRPGMKIKISLPEDFSQQDLRRLGDYLGTLAFPE